MAVTKAALAGMVLVFCSPGAMAGAEQLPEQAETINCSVFEGFEGRLQASPVAFSDYEKALEKSICRSAWLQGEYGKRSLRAGKWDKILQFPLIGVAAAGANLVLHNSGSDTAGATKTLGQLGIATLAYSSVKNIILPSDRSPLFARGWAAMGCIVTEAPLFVGSAATKEHDKYKEKIDLALEQLGVVERGIVEIQTLQIHTLNDDQQKYLPLLAATKLTADNGIAQARLRLEDALADLNAWKLRYQFFEAARLAGEQRVETKLRLAAAVDAGALREQMVAQGTPLGKKQFAATNVDQAVRALATGVSDLARLVNDVRGAARPYRARLEVVAKCPEQI